MKKMLNNFPFKPALLPFYYGWALLFFSAIGVVLLLLSKVDRLCNALSCCIDYRIAALILMSLLFFFLRLFGQGVLTMVSRNMAMKWFDRHRGLASGLSGVAVGFGFSYAPKFFNGLIDLYDWSGAWFRLGILWVLIFAPLIWLFFRDNPEDCGLFPDGATAPPVAKETATQDREYSLREALRGFSFWPFVLGLSLHALTITALTFNVESVFREAGLVASRGFDLFMPVAIVAVLVNLLGGWLSDRVQLRCLLLTMLIGMAMAQLGVIFLAEGLPVYAIIFGNGLSTGLFSVLLSVTWPKYYGRKHLGAISGFCMAMMVLASAIGPAWYSFALQHFGSYSGGVAACLALSVILFIISLFARPPSTASSLR